MKNSCPVPDADRADPDEEARDELGAIDHGPVPVDAGLMK